LREERSLTYGAYSSLSARVAGGQFGASIDCRTEVTHEAFTGLFDLIRAFAAEGPAEEEHARARKYLLGSFPIPRETPGGVAQDEITRLLHGLPEDEWATWRDRGGAVSRRAGCRGPPSGVNATGGRARSPVGLGGAGALGSLLFPELPRLAHVKSRGPRLLRPSEPRPEGEDLELSQALGLSGAVPLLVARDGEEERAPHVFAAFVRAPEALLESARPREPQRERILLGKQAQRHLLGELTRDARALGEERR